MKFYLFLLFVFSINLVHSQTVLGKWKTVDDESGETKSIVEISESNGKVVGKIIKLFPGPSDDPDPICTECDASDPRYKKKIIGMEIIRGMKADGPEYAGGDILDPQNGKIYKSKIWMEGKDLKVRGYWGPFFRTQTWLRAE